MSKTLHVKNTLATTIEEENQIAFNMLARTLLNRGITAQRLNKYMTVYVNDLGHKTSGGHVQAHKENKPLIVMLPWLGSRPQGVEKYCDIYFRTGMDVLVVESEVTHFLWPRWGLDHGKTLLELLQSEPFVSRPLLVHAFSIGAYTFAQLLVHVSKDVQKYENVTKRIKGQVYDSVVVGSVERMAVGVGKIMLPQWSSLVTRLSLAYFGFFKRQTVDYFNVSIDVFWNSPVTSPAVFFYCENDPLSESPTVDKLIDYWQKRGIDVTAKKWVDSTHAGHLKRHPEEYLTSINAFLQSVEVVPLKSKM